LLACLQPTEESVELIGERAPVCNTWLVRDHEEDVDLVLRLFRERELYKSLQGQRKSMATGCGQRTHDEEPI
jgi:hypothetical protein